MPFVFVYLNQVPILFLCDCSLLACHQYTKGSDHQFLLHGFKNSAFDTDRSAHQLCFPILCWDPFFLDSAHKPAKLDEFSEEGVTIAFGSIFLPTHQAIQPKGPNPPTNPVRWEMTRCRGHEEIFKALAPQPLCRLNLGYNALGLQACGPPMGGGRRGGSERGCGADRRREAVPEGCLPSVCQTNFLNMSTK